MATLREYYEKDFSHNTKIHVRITVNETVVRGAVLYDFAGCYAYLIFYIPEKDKDIKFFIDLISSLNWGSTKLALDGIVTLPRAKTFPGALRIENKKDFEVLAQFFGETEWISTKNIQSSKRIFVYSESNLNVGEIKILKAKAKELGQELLFRDEKFRFARSKNEKPLAFISYDSRDRDSVAQKIAVRLQSMLCPVWYDEFSLKVGDNLRESIEKGLKECKKCILVLSPNFISNNGWTKTEFNSIFTRQLIEETNLVLPVWHNVTKNDVYEYSPSLLNIVGLNWENLGEETVCNKLFNAIVA